MKEKMDQFWWKTTCSCPSWCLICRAEWVCPWIRGPADPLQGGVCFPISVTWRICPKPNEDASNFNNLRRNTSAFHHHIYSSSIHIHHHFRVEKLLVVQSTTIPAKDDQAMILKLHFNHIQYIFNDLNITFHAILSFNFNFLTPYSLDLLYVIGASASYVSQCYYLRWLAHLVW